MKDYLDPDDLITWGGAPKELQEPIEDATPTPLTWPFKIAAMSIPLALFALVGLVLL